MQAKKRKSNMQINANYAMGYAICAFKNIRTKYDNSTKIVKITTKYKVVSLCIFQEKFLFRKKYHQNSQNCKKHGINNPRKKI